jgi:hypothetical protein
MLANQIQSHYVSLSHYKCILNDIKLYLKLKLIIMYLLVQTLGEHMYSMVWKTFCLNSPSTCWQLVIVSQIAPHSTTMQGLMQCLQILE